MKKIILFLVAFASITCALKSQTVLFSEDFENGPANWLLTGTWGLTSSLSNSPSNSLTDSPDGNYMNGEQSWATLTSSMDLTGFLSASVSFKAVYDLETNFDFVYLQASDDDFNTSLELYAFTGENALTPVSVWNDYTFSLGAFVGKPNVKIRFMFYSDGGLSFDGFYVDDIIITASNTDNQAPVITYNPPFGYESSVDPFIVNASIMDVSGISSTFLNFSVDGVLQSADIQGVTIGVDSYQYIIPAMPAGCNVEFWITAIDNSPDLNINVSDVYKYISGNHIYYDGGVSNYFTLTGPGSNNPQNTSWAVRFTLPEDASNLVTALIRNYSDATYLNDSMQIHIWKADASGGVGNELIAPFMVFPEAGPNNNIAFTKVDLRSFGSQLMDLTGDIYVGYTVPSGVVNLMINSPGSSQRSFYQNAAGWYVSYADYFIRVVSGSNENDLKILQLISPQSGDHLTASEPVTIKIQNVGTLAQDDIPLSFKVNGDMIVRDTIHSTLAPHDSLLFTFNQTVDFSAFNSYNIEVSIDLPGDQNPSNNQVMDTIIHTQIQICDTVHYDGSNYTGIGLVGGGTFQVAARYPASMMHAHMGGKVSLIRIYLKNLPSACVLKLWGAGSSESPGNIIVSQDISDIISTGWNEIALLTPVTINGDDLWVGYEVSHFSNQYPAGVDAGPPVPDACRINTGNGIWGTTIGNWNIRMQICDGAELLDAGIIGLVSPVTSAGLTSSENITIKVRNSGYSTISSLPVAYSINGGIPVIDTIFENLVTGETFLYTFLVPADFSLAGDYSVNVYTSMPGDMNSYNDHYYDTITHISFTECDTLHYDGVHQLNMGLSTGGTFKIAARFPAFMVTPVVSGMITKVRLYIKDLPSSLILKIWSIGNNSGPGNELYSMEVSGQLLYNSWNEIELASPIVVGPEGFWAGYQITHANGKNPVGCDGGNANINGNWWSMTPGVWSHPPGYTTFGNWNIRVEVCPVEEPGATLEGVVNYANAGQSAIPYATVSLFSGTSLIKQTQADANGHYVFTGINAGNYTLTASCNLPWGGANAIDGLMVLRHFVGLANLEGLNMQSADVTADGNINSLDGLNIVRRFVGIISSFASGDWIFEEKILNIISAGMYNQDILGICAGDTDGSYVP